MYLSLDMYFSLNMHFSLDISMTIQLIISKNEVENIFGIKSKLLNRVGYFQVFSVFRYLCICTGEGM